jgi:uncharacterized repeat protein (TIGR04138 family)
MKKSIEEIARLDGRYLLRAFEFVREGLDRAAKEQYSDEFESKEPRHVTGKQLCLSLADLAGEKWGYLAAVVLNRLGIKSTYDFGSIVYLMVEHKWMYARPEDSVDEFKDVYDFQEVFEKKFQFNSDKQEHR